MVRFDQKENTWSTSFRVIEGIIHVAGGDEYIPIFRKMRVTMEDLILLDDEQLDTIGVEDPSVRKRLLQLFRDLPVVNYYDPENDNILQKEYVDMINNISSHIEFIIYSIMKECKRADNIPANHNALIKPDLKASTVVIKTCDSITEIIDNFNKMHSKSLNKKKIKRSKHKIAVIGSVAIITLSFCFVKSLKYWK